MIATRGLTVRYPGAADPVLTGVDLDVPAGGHVLLLGGSGGGKSTLLRVLAGVVPRVVDADVDGSVEVAGRSPAEATGVSTGYLVQDPADQLVLPTVLDEVAFGLENRAVPAREIRPRVAAALRAVGAAHLVDRRTGDLSGGEGQRVSLAATLVTEPDVLLLDEPTALLDPAAARGVADAVAAARTPARTSVLVEHRLDELPGLPGRTVVLGDRGGVVADGPTARVLRDEARRLAALGLGLPLAAELHAAGLRSLDEVAVDGELAPRTGDGRGDGPAAPVVLRARGLRVRRDGRDVLLDVDLDVRAGRVTAVLGPNGAGKSSLLLALAGLLPVSGSVRGGTVGTVFQRPEHQLLARTVRDEIAWGPRRARRVDVEALVEATLGRYALDGLADHDPFRLSGGQQRRLSLAAAAVCGHDVLLADEPTFGQDRRTALACSDALRALADEGRGVVVVTHDLRLVAELADDVVVLRDARVLGRGPTQDVLGDDALLAAAGLVLPPVVAAARHTREPLRAVLAGLRRAMATATAAATAVTVS